MKKQKIVIIVIVLIAANICIMTALAASNITLTSSQSENTVTLKWSNSDTVSSYTYRIVRSINNGEFNGLSATGNEKIKVLNIYPDVAEMITFTSSNDGKLYTIPKSASLKMWMEKSNSLDLKGFGRGLINVETVSISNFNSNPSNYLYKNSDGKYNYDLILFGTWDTNNLYDLNATSLEVTRNYIESGGKAIFGHDTLRLNTYFPYFSQLAKYVNITYDTNAKLYNGVESVSGGVGASDKSLYSKIKITKTGIFTSYPWYIGGEGTILTVPACHAAFQIASGDIWLRYVHPSYTTSDMQAKANFYLTTYNNCAMIQTGHAFCNATEDEQKILANLIFYLSDLSVDTTKVDNTFVDIDKPNMPTITNNRINGSTGKILVSTEDNGTTYKYYVEATEKVNQTKSVSNTVTEVRKSGIAGYSYVIDNNANTIPDNIIDTTSEEINYNLDESSKTYLHIRAIDNAGNVGEVSHTLLYTNIIVKHVDEYGNELEIEKIPAINGEEYKINSKDFEKYEVKTIPDNANGIVGEDLIEITYVYNLVKGKIVITKVDKTDETKLLSGAIFKLEKLDEFGNIDNTFTILEKTTGENGKAEFEELLVGKYRITEIKAPEGYELNSVPIEVNITNKEKDLNILATDKLKLQLPETGGKGVSLFIIIGSIVCMSSILLNKLKIKKNV